VHSIASFIVAAILRALHAHNVAYALFALSIASAAFTSVTHAVTVGAAAPLATARSNHTSTQLTNGKLLVAGGQAAAPASTPLTSAELYDLFANTWSAAAALPVARTDHTATLLDNGRVLIVGGRSNAASEAALNTAVLYDPTSNTWSNAGNLADARSQHTATRLRSGKILVVGGKNNATVLASAELYDPATNAWTNAGSLAAARRFHTATAATAGINDDVFVIGGSDTGSAGVAFGLSSIERYSISSNSWFTLTQQLSDPRYSHTATALPNGDILVAGGLTARLSGLSLVSASHDRIERFDFVTFAVSNAGQLRDVRGRHSATLLPSGKLMLIGGVNDGISTTYLQSIETFDPAAGSSTLEPAMATARVNHTATLIPTGAVIAVGGRIGSSPVTASNTLVRSADEGSAAAATNFCGVRFHAATTLLADGRVLISGGAIPGTTLAIASVYDPNAQTCTTVAPMPFARRLHTLTLLPSGKILMIGGYATTANTEPSDNVALFDPTNGANGSWSTLPSMQVPRAAHAVSLMPDGRVLVSGGVEATTAPLIVEIFDPATPQWTAQFAPFATRIRHASVLLPSGRLLRIGGALEDACTNVWSSDVYDPVSGLSDAIAVVTRRCDVTATLLPNGKVLAVGGFDSTGAGLASAELFDPLTQTWSATPSLSQARYGHTATLLASGEVLVAGGGASPATSEIYDPVSNTWRNGPALRSDRRLAVAVTSSSGRALLFSGIEASAQTPEIVGPNFAPVTSQTPILNAPSVALTLLNALSLSGSRFRPALQASGGDTAQSASNAPVFTLERVDNGQRIVLPQAPVSFLSSSPFTDTSFVTASAVAAGFPSGHARLRAWVNGVPSDGKIVLVATAPYAPAAPAAAATSITTATVTFSSAAFFNGGAPLTKYGVISTPGSIQGSCTMPCTSIVATGLTPGTTYTFQVSASNEVGTGALSPASNAITLPKRSSSTSVVSSKNPVRLGQAVTFTATINVSGGAALVGGGTMTFTAQGMNIPGCIALPIITANNVNTASCTTTSLGAQNWNINATFSGDAQTSFSFGTVVQTIDPVPSLNIDLSPAPGTTNQAATDGLMILRYLAGFTGTAITNNAMHPSFDRSPPDVPPYLDSIRDALDVNSDGRLDLAIDGVLMVRYMLGMRAATGLFNGVAIGTAMTAGEIENYLALLMPL
jgi:N-acetylneuraminic acid mutarotase